MARKCGDESTGRGTCHVSRVLFDQLQEENWTIEGSAQVRLKQTKSDLFKAAQVSMKRHKANRKETSNIDLTSTNEDSLQLL